LAGEILAPGNAESVRTATMAVGEHVEMLGCGVPRRCQLRSIGLGIVREFMLRE
jgi:hypothetical protein